MRAGKVWMDFDDGTSGWVPVGRVAEAKADGGKIASFGRSTAERLRESTMETAKQAPLAASLAVGGGLSSPAVAVMNPAVRALLGVTGMGTASGAGQGVVEGASRALGYGDAPGTVAGASQQGATLGALGEGASALTQGAATPLMMWAQSNRGGVNAGEAVARARAGLRERIPVGKNPLRPGDVAGSERGANLRMARDAAADAEADAVTNFGPQVAPGVYSGQGVKFNMNTVSPRLQSLVDEAAKIPGYEAQANRLRRIVGSTMRKYGNRDMGLREVREFRQAMDAISEIVKEARVVKGLNPKSLSPVKRIWDGIANDMRDVLRDPAVGSSIAEAEKGVQGAILAEKGAMAGEKGLSWAASRGVPLAAGGAASALHPGPMTSDIPQIIAAGGAASLLSQPWFASRLALGLDNPMLQMLLRRGPAIAGAAQTKGKE